MPQPNNYLPQGGFGYANQTVKAAEGLSNSLKEFGQGKQLRDVKGQLAELGVTGYAGELGKQPQAQGMGGDAKLQKYQELMVSNPELAGMIQPQMQAHQQQMQQAQRQAFDSEMSNFSTNSSFEAIESIRSKFPQFIKEVDAKAKRLDLRSEEQAKRTFGVVDFMLSQGNKEGAAEFVKKQADLMLESNPAASQEWMTIHDGIMDDTSDTTQDRRDIDLLAGRILGKGWFDEKKTRNEAEEIEGKESRAAGMVKPLEMDKDAKELFIANDKELAMNNEEARKLDSLSARMVDPDGNPIEFGGAPETYMRKFKQFWTGMSDDKPQKDLLIKELKGVALSAAFKLKQAGAMSDPEFNQYISTVPTANDSEKIVGPWINNVMKNNKKAFAALTISNKFLEANGTAKSAKEKFVIDIDGKKITVNKGNNIQTVLRKIGQKLSDYTPSVGGSDVTNVEDIDSFLDTL